MKRMIKKPEVYEIARITLEYPSTISILSDIFSSELSETLEELEKTADDLIEDLIMYNFETWIDGCKQLIEHYGCIIDRVDENPFKLDGEQETTYILFHHPEILNKEFAVGVDVRLSDHELTLESGVIDIKRIKQNQRYHAKTGLEYLNEAISQAINQVNPERITIENQECESYYKGMYLLNNLIRNYLNNINDTRDI